MLNEIWNEGEIIEFKNGKPCGRVIVRKVERQEVILADILTGSTYKIEKTEMDERKKNGDLIFLAEEHNLGILSFVDLSEKEQAEVNRRYKFIRKLKESGVTKITKKSAGDLIQEIAQEIGGTVPHWQSVRNWYKSFMAAGEKMRGLYPSHRYKGSRQPRIDIRVIDIINREAVRFFKLNQPKMASIVRNVEAKIIAHNLEHPDDQLKTPTFLTIQKRIMANSYQNKQKLRKGSDVLKAELAGSDSGIITTRVLERVEIDHTQLDIHVLHDDYKTLLGRPFITVLIDHYSHMVLGFQISFENPSFASVCIACLNAFLPKQHFLSKLECEVDWVAHGVPLTLVTDNGNEFWGKNFISVADELGTIFQYCPIRRGNYKSRIERFFGIVNSLVLDDLPGVVRKLGKQGQGYDARQEAKMTFTEFKRYFITWLTNIYHNLPIEDYGMTPNELWTRSEDELPIPFENETELTPILMATHKRELGKGGIRLFSLCYDSSILKDLYRRDGPVSVTIKSNPFDIGSILVLDKLNNIYIKVDCTKYFYAAGLSEFEHKKISEEVRKISRSKFDNVELQQAKVKLSNERDKLHARNKRRKTQITTSKAARSEKIGIDNFSINVDGLNSVLQINNNAENDDLNMDGWSIN